MDDMDIHLHPRSEHPDWIGDAVLTIDEEVLADRMDHVDFAPKG
jgi:hypothetical protein